MAIPLSVQLYSLREQMKDGKHAQYLKKLADLGYKGVECAGLYGLSVKDYRALVESFGMTVSGVHAGIEPGKEQAAIDQAKGLGLDCSVIAWTPPEGWKTADALKKTADTLSAASEALGKAGVSLGYHNHDFEMTRIDGVTALERMATLVPKLKFEIDTYWAANFGAEDPARVVSALKDRAVYLHLKDGPLTKGANMVGVGSGKQDMKKIVAAADPKVTRWLVVELDACDGDMWTAVEDSYHYLVGNGLAAGNKPARASNKG
ncbi:MAG TPA: sugar phosphate isomerase/epimerase [Planctomycetota bacterium]|nr:sugar phosphate isomerase/epimerase [Planctomycetota bacterium]